MLLFILQWLAWSSFFSVGNGFVIVVYDLRPSSFHLGLHFLFYLGRLSLKLLSCLPFMLIQCSHIWTSDIYFVILQLLENLKIEIEILENLLSICNAMMDELGDPDLDDRLTSLLPFINIILGDNRNFVC